MNGRVWASVTLAGCFLSYLSFFFSGVDCLGRPVLAFLALALSWWSRGRGERKGLKEAGCG